jgi:hypothetical protein
VVLEFTKAAGSATLCLVLALGTTGCTNSDIVSSGRSEIVLEALADPPTSPDYGWGRIAISQVTLRPTDPAANQALGTDPMGLLDSSTTADIATSSATLLARTVMSRGEYAGQDVRVRLFELNTDPSRPTGTQCSNGRLVSLFEVRDVRVPFGAADRFTVPPAGTIAVRLRVDGAAFVELLNGKCLGDSFQGFPSAQELEAARVFSLEAE